MIFGTGIDAVEISRIRISLKNPKFLSRIATPEEIKFAKKYSESPLRFAEFVAGRFAAKEAFSKALGLGIGEKVSFKDLSVLAKPNGAPFVKVSSKLQKLLKSLKIKKIHLSITHTRQTAYAVVILEK